MKNGALTFALLVFAGAVGGVAFAGCSSDPEPEQVVADTGTPDTGTADTKVPDTNMPVDMGPVSCAQKLGADFKCTAPEKKVGKKVCTDEMLVEFENCFGSMGDSKKCMAAQTKYKDCNTCMLTDWLYEMRFIDTGACIAAIDATDKCGTVWKCNIDCLTAVCGECDNTPGSGKTATTSEQDDCWKAAQAKGGTTTPKGACYDLATKDYSACASNPKFSACFVRSDIKPFYRGACRDGGDWSMADVDKSMDAGVTDTGTDTGSTDTGAAADTLIPDVALDVLPG